MTENELISIAEHDDIPILSTTCPKSLSMSIEINNHCYIGIDSHFDNLSMHKRKTMLAHELGHCETASFYKIYSPLELISRHEHRADKWAIEKLLPKNEMEEAIHNGYVEVWELAEYFDVTEELIKKALFIYFDNQNFL